MHDGSWRADLPREGEGGQQTGKVRPALERLAADSDCNRDTCSALQTSKCAAYRQVRFYFLILCVCSSAGFLECLLITNPEEVWPYMVQGLCCKDLPCTPVAATCCCPRAPQLRLPIADGLSIVLLGPSGGSTVLCGWPSPSGQGVCIRATQSGAYYTS